MAETEEKKSPEHKSHSLPLDILAYTTSALGGGLMAMWQTTRNYAYKNLLQTGAITDAYKDRMSKLAAIKNPGPESLALRKAISTTYKAAIDEAYHNFGIRNSVDKFRHFLSLNEKVKVSGWGLTVAGVMMGAFFKLRDDRKLAQTLERIAQNTEPKEAQRN